jgi:hypothetical protein
LRCRPAGQHITYLPGSMTVDGIVRGDTADTSTNKAGLQLAQSVCCSATPGASLTSSIQSHHQLISSSWASPCTK